MKVCPSAKPDVNIREMINEICNSDYYKSDYELITSYFIADSVDYLEVRRCFLKTAEELPF